MATKATTSSRVRPKIEQLPFLDHPDVDTQQYLAGIDQALELLGAKFAVYLDHFPQIRDALRTMSEDDRDELFKGLATLDMNDYNRGIQNGMAVLSKIQLKQGLERAEKQRAGHRAPRLPKQEVRAHGAEAATAAKSVRKSACN